MELLNRYQGPTSCDPSQYRPITLLNVDCRIWTFILKNRITQAMQKLIPETQTAFLPGRLSAQNIWIQQSVPALLQAEKKWCLVALCDFQKAYDTVESLVKLNEHIKYILDNKNHLPYITTIQYAREWKILDRKKPLPIQQCTVKWGTQLITYPTSVERSDIISQWTYQLCGDIRHISKPKLHKLIWYLPFENKWKEPFWHITMNSLTTHARENPCACGTCSCPTAVHHYRDCPIAKHVYHIIAEQLRHPEKVLHYIWTGEPPQHFPLKIWVHICTAIVYTIHRGKQHLYRLRYHPQNQNAPVLPADGLLQQGKSLTSNLFWSLLRHFTTRMPPGTENFSNLPIVRWDVHLQKWITKHPPDIQLSGSIY